MHVHTVECIVCQFLVVNFLLSEKSSHHLTDLEYVCVQVMNLTTL